MDDADDFRLGWYGDYSDLRERTTNRQRWRSRAKRYQKKIDDPAVRRVALELARVKQEILILQAQERLLKTELSETIPPRGWTEVELNAKSGGSYLVEHVVRRKIPELITAVTLRYLAKKFGKDLALEVAEQCSGKSKKISAIYVWPPGKDYKEEPEVE